MFEKHLKSELNFYYPKVMTKFKDPDYRQPAIIVYYLSINIVICNLHCNSSMYMPIGIARNTACSCHFYSKHLLSFVLLEKSKKSIFSVTLYACAPKKGKQK